MLPSTASKHLAVALLLGILNAAIAGDGSAVSGEQLDWMLNCQGCHRARGEGSADAVPPIAGHAARFLSVPGGREFLIQVPGVATSPLSSAATARLINWMLYRFDAEHLPESFVPYSAAEVDQLRANPLRKNLEVSRARLVAAIEAQHP